ncbi:hypothetical protein INT45_000434, partial [Circinella minor]
TADKSNRRNLYAPHHTVHELSLPEQAQRKKQPANSQIKVVTQNLLEKKPDIEYSIVYECFVCDYFGYSVDELSEHFNIHLSPTLRNGLQILTLVPIKMYDFAQPGNSTSIKIFRGKRAHTFDQTLADKISSQDTPKITKNDTEKISKIKDILKACHEDQRELRSFTKYPECLKNIRSALSCRNHHDFASFKFPDLNTNITSNKKNSFYRFAKYILWDYSSKCFRNPLSFTNHERTFFSVYIVPVFSHFENQYQDIHFEWCEVSMKSRKVMQSTSSSNADGIGYATNTGIMDDERVIFEASSGPRWEDVQHTYGDTLKNIEALTLIIFLKAYKFSNARFSTLTRYKSVCIHSIKRTLTLSVMSITDDKKFVFEEQRGATVPVGYQEHYYWYEILEFVARLQELLEEQDEVDNDLRSEHSDPTIEEEETIKHIFETENIPNSFCIP